MLYMNFKILHWIYHLFNRYGTKRSKVLWATTFWFFLHITVFYLFSYKVFVRYILSRNWECIIFTNANIFIFLESIVMWKPFRLYDRYASEAYGLMFSLFLINIHNSLSFYSIVMSLFSLISHFYLIRVVRNQLNHGILHWLPERCRNRLYLRYLNFESHLNLLKNSQHCNL